jgi:hypothetical protein
LQIESQFVNRKMSKISNKSEIKIEWTISYLIDRLKQVLATVEMSRTKTKTDLLDDKEFNDYYSLVTNRKYVNQAFHYLKVGAFRPTPAFFISLSDL